MRTGERLEETGRAETDAPFFHPVFPDADLTFPPARDILRNLFSRNDGRILVLDPERTEKSVW